MTFGHMRATTKTGRTERQRDKRKGPVWRLNKAKDSNNTDVSMMVMSNLRNRRRK